MFACHLSSNLPVCLLVLLSARLLICLPVCIYVCLPNMVIQIEKINILIIPIKLILGPRSIKYTNTRICQAYSIHPQLAPSQVKGQYKPFATLDRQ